VAAEERAVDQIVRAAGVGELGRKLRMNRGAVQALVVVLQDQLPVGADGVFDPPLGLEQRKVVVGKSIPEWSKPLRTGHRIPIEVEEEKAFPLMQGDGVERVGLLVKALDFV